jgi:hypothetical protein
MSFPISARSSRALMLCAVLLTACQAKTEAATDEQILLLLGDPPIFEAGGDRIIRKATVECVRLIAGVDEAIYKDASPEMMGHLKTRCRKELDQKLGEKARNNLEIELKDLEDKAFAERLTTLAERVNAEHKAKVEARRQKEEAERKEKERKELAERKEKILAAFAKVESEATAFASGLEGQFQEVGRLCDDWKKLKEQISKADKNSKYRWAMSPHLCFNPQRKNLQDRVAQTAQELADFKARSDDQLTEYGIPRLYHIKDFTERLDALRAEVKTMQALPH